MSYSYADRKRAQSAVPQTEKRNGPGPSQDALRAGTVKPTTEQMGHRVDLPNAIREKMEGAFGADLSAVKLYESEAVADAGANAITQGANIAFAPGMLDFTSYGGQALLGHEMSHVVSQARGEVTGGGFLNDHALEVRADREGAMAAAGQQIAMPTAAMSPVSAAPAAGPMQADKKEEAGRKSLEHDQRELDFRQQAELSDKAQNFTQADAFRTAALKEKLASRQYQYKTLDTDKERMSAKADIADMKADLYGKKYGKHMREDNPIREAFYKRLMNWQDKKSKSYRSKADSM